MAIPVTFRRRANNGAVPLMAAGWSVILLRKLPGRPQLIGLAVGFLGIAAISWPEAQGSRATALGVALVVLAESYGFIPTSVLESLGMFIAPLTPEQIAALRCDTAVDYIQQSAAALYPPPPNGT